LLEIIRLDAPRFGTININQTFMLLVALVSADENVLRVLRELKARSEAPSSVEIFSRAAEARDWIERRLKSRGNKGSRSAAGR
jgi:hypothetical protein